VVTGLPSRFYPVVPNAAAVRAMLEAGANFIQLRVKNADAAQVQYEVRRSMALCEAASAQLVINDHWQLALDLGAHFVHLGQEDIAGADLPSLCRRGIRIGISTHDESELERALSVQPAYIALGPIWPTTLKVMPWAPQGVERLTDWKRRIGSLPLVAIGGITLPRITACLNAGANAVAVVNHVVNAADPVARARSWLDLLRGTPEPT
jgi:thiamine-phosphate pyrophosphorylase